MKSGLPIVRPRAGFSAPDGLEVAASQGLGHWEMVGSAGGNSFMEPLSTEALSSIFVGSTQAVSFIEPLSTEALSSIFVASTEAVSFIQPLFAEALVSTFVGSSEGA